VRDFLLDSSQHLVLPSFYSFNRTITMTFKSIIFDMDGTLLDTLSDIAATMNLVLRSYGWPEHEINEYRTLVGEGIENLVSRSIPPGNRQDDLISSLVIEYRKYYAGHWADQTEVYPGINELISELDKRKISMSILSNKSDVFTKKMAESFFPKTRFAAVIGSMPGKPNKPDPTSAAAIADIAGVRPAKMIFLGDSSIDMKTAAAAGMCPVGVLWGFRSRDELVNSGASSIISAPMELLDLL
jgi:phosphoglycolate phosphatase